MTEYRDYGSIGHWWVYFVCEWDWLVRQNFQGEGSEHFYCDWWVLRHLYFIPFKFPGRPWWYFAEQVFHVLGGVWFCLMWSWIYLHWYLRNKLHITRPGCVPYLLRPSWGGCRCHVVSGSSSSGLRRSNDWGTSGGNSSHDGIRRLEREPCKRPRARLELSTHVLRSMDTANDSAVGIRPGMMAGTWVGRLFVSVSVWQSWSLCWGIFGKEIPWNEFNAILTPELWTAAIASQPLVVHPRPMRIHIWYA